MKQLQSLNHTVWECKYHVVWIPKYRKKVLYGSIRQELVNLFRELANRRGCTILEGHLCADHVHMLLEIPPKMSVSSFMGYLKGKSSQIIYERWANARYKYRNREFWCRGYYVDTVGKNTKKIKEYIANQLKEDKISDQMTIEEIDPFKG